MKCVVILSDRQFRLQQVLVRNGPRFIPEVYLFKFKFTLLDDLNFGIKFVCLFCFLDISVSFFGLFPFLL